MANNKGKTVSALDLLTGTGALTAAEGEALAREYRTAQRAEGTATLKMGRVIYVFRQRENVLDADGNAVTSSDFAKAQGITGAAVTHGHQQYGYVVLTGLHGESDAIQREAYVLAQRTRKLTPGRDKGAQAAFADDVAACLRDIAALPVGERIDAWADAVRKGSKTEEPGVLVALAKEYRDGSAGDSESSAGTREANETPQTSGEKAAADKSNALDALDAILTSVAADPVALTSGDADRAARVLGNLAAALGVNIEAVREYHDATAAEFAAA